VAPAFCDVFEVAPSTTDDGYLPWLLETIARHRVDLIFPGIEIDMYTWAARVEEIKGHGAVVVLNSLELIELCKDKWVFYEKLSVAGMACVIASRLSGSYASLCAEFGLPFLLKPRRGFASQGIIRVDSEDVFARHQAQLGATLMAQRIVGSDEEEYTTSAFCDGSGGVCASMTLRRRLSKDGFTDRAEVVETDEFAGIIESLCQLLKPLGPTNFQFRKEAGGHKLLEINPRISSASSIRAAFGYNESAMALEYFLEGRLPSQPAIRRGRAIRYTEEHVVYDDRIHR
jgi:carbamoyl-phosphate synthase large subunit